MKRSGSRVRLPHKIEPGALPRARPGDRLTCLVLCRFATEWVGVDLGSGAFVRVPGILESAAGTEPSVVAVAFTVAPSTEGPDPARPEWVVPADQPKIVGAPRPRAVRRYLRKLATPESHGAVILGTRGPSIAFVDLDGTAGSVELLAIPAKSLELSLSERDEPVCVIPWGGTTQRTRVVDDRAAQAAFASAPRPLHGPQITAALGFRPNYVLIGLGDVTDGHVPKLVLSLL